MADSRWNVKRGPNRLFVVSAICGYIAAGFILWPKWAAAIRAERASADWFAKNPLSKPAVELSVEEKAELDRVLEGAPKMPQRPKALTLGFLFAPPALYVFAGVLLWVARGFRSDTPSI